MTPDEKEHATTRREAEREAEAPREGIENLPEGRDIQELVQDQGPEPRRADSSKRPGERPMPPGDRAGAKD